MNAAKTNTACKALKLTVTNKWKDWQAGINAVCNKFLKQVLQW
jgi:hypothetical protein